jgi:CelD/BcsL family acetyltransferase involved in cellulose biosynthesis
MLSTVRHKSFHDLAAEWDPLRAESLARGPFLSWEWQSLWWDTFGGDRELWLLAIREGDALVGIAPFMAWQGRISFSCGSDVCDYLDILARPGHEEAVARVIVSYLMEQDWESLDLSCLPPTATGLRHVPVPASQAGLSVETSRMDVCPGLDLPGDWESYLASLSKKDRHELRRKMRRLADATPARSYVLVDGEIGAGEVEDFLALHRLSTAEKAGFMDAGMEGFFRGIFGRFTRGGLLRLYFMEIDGRRVATALCFDHRGEVLLYNSGYDPAYARLSTGLLLKAFCVQDTIALGRRRFDFLRGDERYKYDLGGRDVPLYRLRVVRRD